MEIKFNSTYKNYNFTIHGSVVVKEFNSEDIKFSVFEKNTGVVLTGSIPLEKLLIMKELGLVEII